jgi:hypothetical protein
MHTTIKLLATTFAVLLVFISCKKEEEEAVASDKPKEIILPRVQPIPTGNYVAPPVQQQQVQQTVPNNQAIAQTPVVTKPGMNPPHGQPGHRCDIQVGAPLNSKPAVASTATSVQPGTATSKQITMPTTTSGSNGTPAILQPNAASTTTAPGMNPPHGEEGHQCGIAVGAPLPK